MTEQLKTSRLEFRPKEESLASLQAWRDALADRREAAARRQEEALRAAACEVAGAKQPDGTILVGEMPDGKKLYTMPRNASIAMDFNEAAAHARRHNNKKTLGHDDWRVPTKEELYLLYQNRAQGALKGSFECTYEIEERTDGDFWSSTQISPGRAHMRRISDGSGCTTSLECPGIVRLVR